MTTDTTVAPQLPSGTVLDGMYTTGECVRTRVGTATYQAKGPGGEKVAVTVYAADCFATPVVRERSLREIRQLEAVSDSRVLKIVDSGKLEDGGIYEVHEDVTGQTLGEVIAAGGAMPADDAEKLLRDILGALEAGKKAGVLHRNVGANAILVTDAGIKVSNFAVGEPNGGSAFGAADCIAPEQVAGKNINERTLVYNLAALTYQVLTGQTLFAGDATAQVAHHAKTAPPPDGAHEALIQALSKAPKSRPKKLKLYKSNLAKIVKSKPEVGERTETAEAAPE
ncbi:MAG: protein kinase domain-containing protein, partial [Nannocystaceae bacterium]